MAYKRNYKSANGFSPQFNREVGSLVCRLVFLVIFAVALKIWGIGVLDDIYIYIITFIAYKLTGFFLHKIGFWPRWRWFNI